MTAIVANLTAATALRPYLERCGYRRGLLRANFRFGERQEALLAAFAHEPADARSACIAVAERNGDPAAIAASYRALGAPVVFLWHSDALQWWKQSPQKPQLFETIRSTDFPRFFQEHQQEFAPEAIYRAKTWGRFKTDYQLTFVDVGLLPLVEGEIGRKLSEIIERVVLDAKSALRPKKMTDQLGHWLLRSVFWLLAAKILQDKAVPGFLPLDMSNPDDVLQRVARHYGTTSGIAKHDRWQRQALARAAGMIEQFAHLGHVTTESLTHVYENALISKETRSRLGTHGTPSYLVDYVVWQLAPWVSEIQEEERDVFEPACGHGAFLVSAMRLLRELLPSDIREHATKRRTYLHERLHGVEIDAFALEIARLRLTLADIPNPDGWDLQAGDMFVGDVLESRARRSSVLLANPPFENFTTDERKGYSGRHIEINYGNKTAEMLGRTLPYLKPGSVFGVVMPQGLLHSKDAADLRRLINREFEIAEICLFPDKIFAFSDMESAIIVGRKCKGPCSRSPIVTYSRVREQDAEHFKESYSVTTKREISQKRFSPKNDWDMRIPDLEEIWEWCRHNPRFGELFELGQGLSYKGGRRLPRDAVTISNHLFQGAAKGFARLDRKLQIHEQPEEVWLNLDRAVTRQRITGTTVGIAQVLLNYARVGRGPWRLKALIDREGHAVTSRFITIRPMHTDWPLEFVWALCNSPFASGYAYAHSMKRDILVGTMRAMPLPRASLPDAERVAELVLAYFEVAGKFRQRTAPGTRENALSGLLLRIDAEILRLYDLPPRLERQLLDLFAGSKRLGVPFHFDRYFPEDFEPWFPLHQYLSEAYQRSTAGQLRARHENLSSPHLLAAFENAIEGFRK